MKHCLSAWAYWVKGFLAWVILGGLPAVLSGDGFTEATVQRIVDLSGDGRYILQHNGFTAPGMAAQNMSVLDHVTGEVDPVNYGPDGGFVSALYGSISADGRHVAFEASNNRTIYLRDRLNRTTRIISNAPDGTPQNGFVSQPSLSNDGAKVVFFTTATNLVAEALPAAAASYGNLILWEAATGGLSLAARAHDGAVLDAAVFADPGLPLRRFSGDGRYIVYSTAANNAHPSTPNPTGGYVMCYRRDLVTGEVLMISTTAEGQAAIGNYTYPAISADGSKVAFLATFVGIFGPQLVPGTPSTFGTNVYLKDLATGAVTLVSPTLDGAAPSGSTQGTTGRASAPLSMNGDGRLIAYQSSVRNFVAENAAGRWGIILATVQENGSYLQRYLSNPIDGSANDGEAANVLFARASDRLSMEVSNRAKFLLPAGTGFIFYDAPGGGSPTDFFEPGAYADGAGRIYSPSLGWVAVLGDAGWAYSHGLERFLFFDFAGPGIGGGDGYWFVAQQDGALFWAHSRAALWWQVAGGFGRSGVIYIPSGPTGAPGWFVFSPLSRRFQPI